MLILDFLKIITKKNGETVLIPFASALSNNDLHISLHNASYGMHFKINNPHHIQSKHLKYEELMSILKNGTPRVLKQIVRLPRRGHYYYWIIPKIRDSGISVKEGPKRTIIKMSTLFLDDLEIRQESETHFIPKDLTNLRKYHDQSSLIGLVPDTNEIFNFIPLSKVQLDYLARIVEDEDFDYSLYLNIGGVFITIDLNDGMDFFRECFPQLFEILFTFFQEVDDKGLNLYNMDRLSALFNLAWAFP